MYIDEDEEMENRHNHTMSIRSGTSSKGTSALGYTPLK